MGRESMFACNSRRRIEHIKCLLCANVSRFQCSLASNFLGEALVATFSTCTHPYYTVVYVSELLQPTNYQFLDFSIAHCQAYKYKFIPPMSSRLLLEPPLMVGRQRGSSGYESTRVRPVTIILRPVCSLCVYTVYLWKQEHCFRKFSSLEIYGAFLLVVMSPVSIRKYSQISFSMVIENDESLELDII